MDPQNLPTTGTKNNLSYYGGPVVHSIKNYLIWWLPRTGTTTYGDANNTACTIPATLSYSYEQPASGTATVGALPGGPDGDTGYGAADCFTSQPMAATSTCMAITTSSSKSTATGTTAVLSLRT